MDVFVCEVLRCPYINLNVDTMYMYVRMYGHTPLLLRGTLPIAIHHTGRAIWHEQQQQQQQQSMSMSWPQ